MDIKSIKQIIFSPTGTSGSVSKAVCDEISSLMDTQQMLIDTTTAQHTAVSLSREDVAIFSAPVYGGHLPAIVKERWKNINGNNTPAIVIAVYGNRNYENAVSDMINFAIDHGFVPIAAAAFIGEHSYSTAAMPIAPGRPDAEDISAAREFGRLIADKITAGNVTEVNASDFPVLTTPEESLLAFKEFVVQYQESQKKNPVKLSPVTDSTKCSKCGQCVTVCPVQAITSGNETETDRSKCIKCCACVKRCPEHARTLSSPFAGVLSRYYSIRRKPVYII